MAIISEKSTVTFGVCFVLAGVIWWAATLQAKVDDILKFEAVNSAAVETLKTDVANLKTRVQVLEDKKEKLEK